jgi:hypothetical protein
VAAAVVVAACLWPGTVRAAEDDGLRSFRNDVLTVLTKNGCNAGACHGALAGKGGFRLSLRGYDPAADYLAITREAQGRRIELSDPGRSLLLAKPSGALPHKGGLRFETDTEPYQIIADWIAQGAPPPRDEDPRVEQIAVEPLSAVLKPGQQQHLAVTARYSDGRVVDVTRWCRFSSSHDSVARVDNDGQITVVGSGEGAVVAALANQIAIARLTVPYGNPSCQEQLAGFHPNNFIDREVRAQWERLNLAPSPPVDDATLLRRIFLDTIGTLPTADEARGFLADASPDKVDRLIESLLAREEYVDYWTYKWSDLMLVNGQMLRPPAVKAYYQWIRQQVAANTPWDRFARQVVLARGSSYDQAATNFYALHQDAEAMTENICQAFLGLSIGCAKCHNHPLEKWTNDQYYAMANLFSRVRAKGWGGEPRDGDGLRTLYLAAEGELIQPSRGKPQPPTPLDGSPLAADAPGDRREAVADWLTAPKNPYFARAIANRIWANFFGVALVEPVDDMRASNPASNEALLTALANHLVESKYDLKALIRAILQSQTYRLSSQPLEENAADSRFYSRFYPRRMMSEVLLDAVAQVTGVPDKFTQVEYPGADFQDTKEYPPGTRAIQLHDSAVASSFLKSFGRNPRNITCECQRSNEPSLVQALHLTNGDTINQKLRSDSGRVHQVVSQQRSGEQIIEDLYLSALSRYPSGTELQQLLRLLGESTVETRRDAVEDLYWSVLSSREFLFHH